MFSKESRDGDANPLRPLLLLLTSGRDHRGDDRRWRRRTLHQDGHQHAHDETGDRVAEERVVREYLTGGFAGCGEEHELFNAGNKSQAFKLSWKS